MTIDVAGIDQRVLSWDVPSIMGLYTVQLKNPSTASTNKFDVHEKIKTGFLRVDIDADWGVPVHGNLGVQVVRSDQDSNGFATTFIDSDHAVVEPVNGGATYTDVLPSLNLVFDLQHDLLLRFGLGKTMARPRMDDMRAGADAPRLEANTGSTTEGHWVADGGGKPDLAPWRAKSVDLSVEKYFQKRSYVALAGFLKKLDTFIYAKETTRDFTGFPNDSILTPGCAPIEPNCNPNLGTVTTQANGSGGKVYGFEASASLDGGLFTPALDGIGLIMSYANTRNSLPKRRERQPDRPRRLLQHRQQFRGVFREGRFLDPDQHELPLGVYGHHAQRATGHTEKHADRCREVGRRADRLLIQLGRARRPDAAAAGEQPHQRALNHTAIARNRGSVGSSSGLLPWVDENFGRVTAVRRVVQALRSRRAVEACRGR